LADRLLAQPRAAQRAEERLKNLTDVDRDPAVSFESTGIDYLAIDEAHGYKNLQIASNIPGASNEGSQRASDLDMKLHYLRERHGHRVATFATATPIANSVAEAYVMQRYLRPDVLDAAGLTDFAVGRLECQWQRDQLAERIRELVLDDQRVRNDICWSVFDC